MTEPTCGYTVTDDDGEDAPCDLPATGWRWYQDVEHEDTLAAACIHHENEGGRRMHAAEVEVGRRITRMHKEWAADIENLTLRAHCAEAALAAERKRLKAAPRFWSKVDFTDTCWLWTGGKSNGYGKFRFGPDVSAHRWAYESVVGPIPEGYEVDHLCRVRACVNPDHLEAVTPQVNTRRAHSLTHCRNGHERTDENTYRRANGYPRCRECDRASHRARRAKGYRL